MKNIQLHKQGFTLIELLMVIAIIGILAGILIPTVGAVRKQANIAASKSQLSNYATAIQMFKGEYNYYPFVTGGTDFEQSIPDIGTETFITTLSGRDSEGRRPSSTTDAELGGNRRMMSFYSFSESEFFVDSTSAVLVDQFDNSNIVIVIDGDGDGQVTPAPTDPSIDPEGPIRTDVTAYTDADTDTDGNDDGDPTYSLYNVN